MSRRTSRGTFHIIGQSDYGAVPRSGAYVVLDTSVLSIMEGIALNGYQPCNIQHRRAAHLLRWLSHHRVEYINTTFAVIEGAGFHAGAVSLHNVLRRYVPFEALRLLDEQELEDFLSTQSGFIAGMDRRALEDLISATLDDATDLLPATFGPAYITALRLRLCHESGMSAAATAEAVMTMLADELNFVPAVPWAATILSCFGRGPVRQGTQQELMKHQMADKGMACRSAAWDLAYLQFLSTLRSDMAAAPQADISQPVLVTDDDGLMWLASRLHARGHAFSFDDDALLDPSRRAECDRVIQAMQARRQFATPTVPDLSSLRHVAHALENALGVGHLDFQVRPLRLPATLDTRMAVAMVKALRLEGSDLLDELVRIGSGRDPLHTALTLTPYLVEDNARARNRTPVDTLTEIIRILRGPSEGQDPPRVAEQTVVAWVQRDEITATAGLEQIERIEPALYPASLLYAVAFLKTLLTDTAAAWGEPLAPLVERLAGRLAAVDDPS